MAHIQKSLLEAFQQSTDERQGGSPAPAGPFAGQPTEPSKATPSLDLIPSFSIREARSIAWLAGVAVGFFLLGLLVGRWAAGAGGGPDPGAPADDVYAAELPATASEPDAAGDAAAGGGVDADEALFDAANRYTVIAVTYGLSSEQQAYAWETHRHFRARGLPVATPVGDGSNVYVLVGAAPTAAELEAVRDRVRAMTAPDGRAGQYASAYVVPIESVLDRR